MTLNKKMNETIAPYHDLTDFPAQKYIQINNCGIKQNYPSHQAIVRPNGRKDYSLLYVDHGWIEVSVGEEIVRLEEGECILYMPGVRQETYFTSEGDPNVYYVYFTGAATDEAVSLMDIKDSLVCTVENRTMFRLLFRQMSQIFRPLKVMNGRKPVSQPNLNGLLLQLIDVLYQSKIIHEKPESSVIMPALYFMSDHFHEQVNLEQCAAMVNLSLGRFAHLFTKQVGLSPYRFILSLRIDEAKDLLVNSSMSVNDVARQIGFSDPCYFSRIFRKYAGCSPKEYRRKRQGNP